MPAPVRPPVARLFPAVLALASAAAAAPAERPPVGEFVVPRLAQPPVPDGKVGPGEWDGAFTTSGLLAAFDQQLLTSDTAFSLAWDAERLYVLARCRRGPSEWRLTKGVRFNDDYDFGDPSIEVWVAPPKLVPEAYQSILNTYPAVMDNQQIPSRGYTGAGWRGNWQIGVAEDPDGYVIEAAIPFRDFGVEAVKDGDRWAMLLCRTCQGARPRSQGSWSYTQGFAEIAQYPPVTFRDDDVAVRLEDVHTLHAPRYRIPLTLVAPRGRDERVSVEFRWHAGPTPGGETDVVETREAALRAGGRETLVFEGEAPAAFTASVNEQQVVNGQKQQVKVDRRRGVLSVAVKRADGSALFRQSFAYTVSGWQWARPVPPPDAPPPRPLSARVMYGPETHSLVLRADILALAGKERVAAGRVRILDPAAGDRELAAAPLPPFREWYADLVMPLGDVSAPVWDHRKDDEAAAARKLAAAEASNAKEAAKEARERHAAAMKRWEERKAKDPARAGDPPAPPPASAATPTVPPLPDGPAPRVLAVETSVADASGAVLATDRQELKLLRHRFTWQGTDAGVTDKVIPPWTPVAAQGDRFGVWNRAMRLDGLGLARSLDNGGTAQVRSMRLVAVVGGREVEIAGGAPKLGKRAEAFAEFEGAGEAAGLRVSARNRIEFDGCLVSDLTIAPARPGAPVRVDELFWEVVLPAAEATHYCATAGGWAAVHDALPDRWTSQQTGSGVLAGDFVPYIWLNNGERAFLWFADNDRGWITEPERRVATQEIVREGDTVRLRVRFIEVPTDLATATTLRHGWMAFPSRPLPPGARAVICGQGREDYPGARFTHFWFDGDWAVLWPYYCSPFPWSMAKSKAMFEGAARRGPDHRPCVGSIAHSIGRYQDYEGRYFGEFAVDWGEMPGVIGNSDVTQSAGPNDFRLHHYRRWVREAGFKGLYIDENYISFDRNPLTGGAYVRADGRVQPGYGYLGLREYFKRMMIMFHQEGVARPNLWQHVTGGAAYHAWYGDILMEGENVEPTDEKWDYIEVLPAGRMIAIGSPACNGSTTIMMCQAQRHPTPLAAKHIHQFVGWVMAHDILPEGVRWYGPLAQAARLHADEVRFRGYWRDDAPARTATPDCRVSAHLTKDRAILWIVNTAREARRAEVALDWKALGLDPAKTAAFDAESGADLALAGGRLAVAVEPRDFVAVLLVESAGLAEGRSFAASFDAGLPAEEAVGCEMLVGAANRVDDGRGGQALDVSAAAATLWGHLNLREAEGRLAFRARVSDAGAGALLRTTAPAPRGASAAGPSLVVERRKRGREPEKVVLRLDAKPGPGEPPAPAVETEMALAAGWHDVALAWSAGRATLEIDGRPAGAIAIPGMGLGEARGEAILGRARFAFGGKGSCIDALDDVRAWRSAK